MSNPRIDLIELASSYQPLTETEILELLQTADQSYYNSDSPIIPDTVYDYYRGLVPKTKPISLPTPVTGRKIKLPYNLGSMDKTKAEDEHLIIKWLKENPGPYSVSLKLDGVSALYYHSSDKKYRLFTRGDGQIGQDISFLLKHLDLPEIPEGNGVRGELILPKSEFRSRIFLKSDSKKYENARNAVSGLANSLETNYHLDIAKTVDFVSYELILPRGTQLPITQQFHQLHDLGFNVVHFSKLTHLTPLILSQLYDRQLEESRYEIDGLILQADYPYTRNTSGNPNYAVAYKKNLENLTAVTTVEIIEWNVSRTEVIKPVIILQPIKIDGVTISRVTGNNAKYIRDAKIGPGAIIRLIRSGGVIPKVLEVIQPAQQVVWPSIPFIWNETGVDIIALDRSNEVKRIYYFLSSLKVEKIGEKTVERILEEYPFLDLNQFLRLTSTDLAFLGSKISQTISDGLKHIFNGATINQIAAASGLFGRGIGIRKLDLVTSVLPNFWLQKTPPIVSDLTAIHGVGKETASLLVEHYQEFQDLYQSIRDLIKKSTVTLDQAVIDDRPKKQLSTINSPVEQKQNKLTGKKTMPAIVVLSDLKNKAKYDKLIKERGGTSGSSVTQSTNLLVIGDESVHSTKRANAEKKGIPIITLEEFERDYL